MILPIWLIKILNFLYIEHNLDDYRNYEYFISLKKFRFSESQYQNLYESILEKRKITTLEFLQLNRVRIKEIDNELKRRKKVLEPRPDE